MRSDRNFFTLPCRFRLTLDLIVTVCKVLGLIQMRHPLELFRSCIWLAPNFDFARFADIEVIATNCVRGHGHGPSSSGQVYILLEGLHAVSKVRIEHLRAVRVHSKLAQLQNLLVLIFHNCYRVRLLVEVICLLYAYVFATLSVLLHLSRRKPLATATWCG